jgi:hypothetical protein
MTIEVNTRTFEFSHGRRPRGHGGWAFGPTPDAQGDDIIWAHGLYSEAVRQAKAVARERGLDILVVLP